MQSFKFNSNTVTLDFNGKLFDVCMDSDFSRRMKALAKECDQRAKAICDEGCNTENVGEFLTSMINSLLGQDAADSILEGRVYDIYDLCDILVYICDAYSEHSQKRLAFCCGEEVDI